MMDEDNKVSSELPSVIPLPHETIRTGRQLVREDELESELNFFSDVGSDDNGGGGAQTVVVWGGLPGPQGLPRIKKLPNGIDRIVSGETHSCGWKSSIKGLYCWGSNDSLQLGVPDVSGISGLEEEGFPHSVPKVADDFIKSVACGQAHTAVVINSGSLVCFGLNEFGQCGVDDSEAFNVLPREVAGVRNEKFVKVACGDNFTLALTKGGVVYGFGLNDNGQLAGLTDPSYFKPTILKKLYGLPIVDIACGESHVLALTAMGTLYSWGKNKYGELGLGHLKSEKTPQIVTSLNGIRVLEVKCGANHSVVTATKNRIYSFGLNNYGQCGTGGQENVTRPYRITCFGEKEIEQVSCGRFHTICLVEQDVFAFGRNDLGQCYYSNGEIEIALNPVQIPLVNKSSDRILRIRASAFSCYAVVCRVDSEFGIEDEENKSSELRSSTVSRGSLSGSAENTMPRNELYHISSQKIIARCALAQASQEYGALIHLVTKTLSNCACLNSSFLSHREEDMLSFLSIGLDLESVRSTFSVLLGMSVLELSNRMSKSLNVLLEDISANADLLEYPDTLRFIFILYELPQWRDPGFSKNFLTTLNKIVVGLRPAAKKLITKWFVLYDENLFIRLIRDLQDRITNVIDDFNGKIDGYLISIVLILDLLHNANNQRSKPIPCNEFYNSNISRCSQIHLEEHYVAWVSEKYSKSGQVPKQFSFCKYPFILDAFAKQEILKYEATLQMRHEAQRAIQASFFWLSAANPFFILQIRRQYLLYDTLVSVNDAMNNPSLLKRPLKVVFVGEDGVDEGGVKKEFFQLIVREIFKEEFGMFTYNSESRNFWFNMNSFETEAEYRLIGIILGLGIYNLTNLDVHFPQIVYKKLCKETVGLKDLIDFDPQIYKSMKELLSFEGDIENIFCLNFTVTHEYFGTKKVVELKKDGSNISVNSENRAEYVELYTKYLLVDSIDKQFQAFAKGFDAVIGGPALSLLCPLELENLICGNTYLDFAALEAKTIYRGGFHAESRVIRWFWNYVNEMSPEEHKLLLKFTTGSDRAPLRGLGHLPFVIQNAGANTSQLPTAHTCFNTLLIPNYNSEHDLRTRLSTAIRNAEGFGLQ